jgi:hypothetical protein
MLFAVDCLIVARGDIAPLNCTRAQRQSTAFPATTAGRVER